MRILKSLFRKFDTQINNLTNMTVYNENVIMRRFDTNPVCNNGIFEHESIFTERCDTNFIADWVDRCEFRLAKRVFIRPHPYNRYYLINGHDDQKYVNKFNEINLHDKYNQHKKRWWHNIDSIKSTALSDYDKLMNHYSLNLKFLCKE